MIRKIMTKEERDKLDTRNKRIVGIVLGIILLISSVGYAFMTLDNNGGTSTSKLTYNGVKFQQTASGTWSFNYNGKDYETLFTPLDTANISVNTDKMLANYYNMPLYLGIDKKEDIASNGNYEIAKNLQGTILKSQFSCLTPNCTENYPVKNCSSNVIIFKMSETNNSRITSTQNCVTISYALGQEERATDAFLFKIIGI